MAEVDLRSADTLPSQWEVSRLAQRLREHLPALHDRYHIDSVALFGSYVRNEQRPDSDLDVLMTFSRTLSLFDLIALENDLADVLGVPIDIAKRDQLHPRLARYILREAVEL